MTGTQRAGENGREKKGRGRGEGRREGGETTKEKEGGSKEGEGRRELVEEVCPGDGL